METINTDFLNKAKALAKPLKKWFVKPVGTVRIKKNPTVWQGWEMIPAGDMPRLYGKALKTGSKFILDFGDEFVGRFQFGLRAETLVSGDSPVRLKFIFAEMPLEIGERNRKYSGGLSQAWLQEDVVTCEDLPQTYILPRIYAMRYVYVEVLAGFRGSTAFFIENIKFKAQSAFRNILPPLKTFDKLDILMDRAAQRTLQNCMQDVILDGPKRDRRLWAGDLWVEAQTVSVTCRDFDAVERSIYLLAAFSNQDGHLPACMYDKPFPHRASCLFSDQAFLFSDLVLFHYRQTGKIGFLKDLYDVCRRQFQIYHDIFADGLPSKPTKGFKRWTNIDWSPLDQSVGELGCYIFGLRSLAEIARILKKKADAKAAEDEAEKLSEYLRRNWFDKKQGVFVSGPEREVSWGSQIWMVLADVVTGEEARRVMGRVEKIRNAVKPATPWLFHHLLEVYTRLGEPEKMHALMRQFWGAMIEKGMTVYPEIFSPENDRLTPYGDQKDPRINSACHAYGAAPAYYLRCSADQ